MLSMILRPESPKKSAPLFRVPGAGRVVAPRPLLLSFMPPFDYVTVLAERAGAVVTLAAVRVVEILHLGHIILSSVHMRLFKRGVDVQGLTQHRLTLP